MRLPRLAIKAGPPPGAEKKQEQPAPAPGALPADTDPAGFAATRLPTRVPAHQRRAAGAKDKHRAAGPKDKHGAAAANDKHGGAGANDKHGAAAAQDEHGAAAAQDQQRAGEAAPTPAAPAIESPSAGRPPASEPGPQQPAPPGAAESWLSARLTALARMIQIGNARSGREGFSKKLLAEAEEVLARAGDRMRMSSAHTIVVLAGGTGSGKSSLFNRLAGADFSAVGVTRPVTKEAHACIWGDPGSGALLDWLAIPRRNRYSRASALDSGEDDLTGLLLLDLPDHDSVMSASSGVVDRLVTLADVMIWVLDPQKYADAAVHRRFLVPLAGHSDVLAVVLNQSDLLERAQIDDCLADLRRLLDVEHLPDIPILVTSAITGAGFEELRKLLVDGVATHRAAAARISADVDGVAARFKRYGGGLDTPVPTVPHDTGERLTEGFLAAAGVSAVGDALRSARELRAADFVGWPVAWLWQRLSGRDPLRKVRLSMLWDDLRSVTAGPSGAQQAEIDNALTEFGDHLAEPLPTPWSGTVRTAARARADQIPGAIGNAIGEALPAERAARWWWWLGDMWQGLLAGAAGLGVLWLAFAGVIHAFGLGGGGLKDLFAPAVLPWVAIGVAAALLLGWLTELVSMRVVSRLATREDAGVSAAMVQNIAEVAMSMVVMPVQQELSELHRYRDALRMASSATPLTVTNSRHADDSGGQ